MWYDVRCIGARDCLNACPEDALELTPDVQDNNGFCLERCGQKIGTETMMKLIATLVTVCCVLAIPVTADGPITVGETIITNDYPESVTFEVQAASTSAPIVSVDLNLAVRGDISAFVKPAEFTPAQQVVARYTWKTRKDDVPPGASIQYAWTVRDEAGNTFTTEPADYVIMDARFTWRTLENDDVALWWYEGDAEFGQRVFDAATRALAAMKQHTGESLPHRIHIVLYSDDADFDAWHDYVREWVAGEAFPRMGLTVQIVPPRDTELAERWIQAVIPHEIAHLFFYQVTHNPLASGPPTWLNEGFAQYHEFVSRADKLAWVRQVAQSGELIPLRLASGSFSGDDERISLLYAESLSAVTFLFECWGDAGMARLLAAYKAGSDTDEALLETTGLNFEEFQRAWWEWLGGQSGMYPTPPPSAGIATARPPADRPTVPPAPTISATPTADAPASSPCCVPCPCVGVLGLLSLLAVLGWHKT